MILEHEEYRKHYQELSWSYNATPDDIRNAVEKYPDLKIKGYNPMLTWNCLKCGNQYSASHLFKMGDSIVCGNCHGKRVRGELAARGIHKKLPRTPNDIEHRHILARSVIEQMTNSQLCEIAFHDYVRQYEKDDDFFQEEWRRIHGE